mmetsp:Transcript_13516/g.19941  ORF Transcript_13516/g.19941 Transcript_13516/m.19941 type:complete len:80 (+) Transcript_13516:146-385(+)
MKSLMTSKQHPQLRNCRNSYNCAERFSSWLFTSESDILVITFLVLLYFTNYVCTIQHACLTLASATKRNLPSTSSKKVE